MLTLRQTLKFINRQFHEVSDAMLSYIFINFSLMTRHAWSRISQGS